MDWRVFLATFGAVFLAELADKTQFVGLGMSAKSGRPLSVWLGEDLTQSLFCRDGFYNLLDFAFQPLL